LFLIIISLGVLLLLI